MLPHGEGTIVIPKLSWQYYNCSAACKPNLFYFFSCSYWNGITGRGRLPVSERGLLGYPTVSTRNLLVGGEIHRSSDPTLDSDVSSASNGGLR